MVVRNKNMSHLKCSRCLFMNLVASMYLVTSGKIWYQRSTLLGFISDGFENIYTKLLLVTLPEDVVEGLCILFCSTTVPNPPNASSYKKEKENKSNFCDHSIVHYIPIVVQKYRDEAMVCWQLKYTASIVIHYNHFS